MLPTGLLGGGGTGDLTSPAFEVVLSRLANAKPMLVLGMIEARQDLLFNTAVVVNHGRLVGSYRKTHLHAGETIFTPGTSYSCIHSGKVGVWHQHLL